MARIGPVILSVVGDEYVQSCRILAVIWEGATTAADTATLRCRMSGNEFWFGRTDTTQTYLGANFGPNGIHAPGGFRLTQISAGRVLVYLRQEM